MEQVLTFIDYINRTLKVQRQLGKKPNTTAGDFPAKMFTKQEIGPKTPSSYRSIPIPDYVFETILEERKVYEKNRRRRSGTFQDLDYICCSTDVYGDTAEIIEDCLDDLQSFIDEVVPKEENEGGTDFQKMII